MKMSERMRKVLSILLAFSLVLSYVPMPALAEEGCNHHVHDESCGYVQGVDCKHVHGEGCGDVTVTKCVHTHGEDGCTYVPGTPAVSCHPEHNEACGYAAGASCGCDLSEGKAHVENCGYVAETPCNVTHGADCGCAAEIPASGKCNHSCTAESGCVTTTFVCAHADHDETCGYVEGKDCTFDPAACEQCNVIANQSADWCGNPLCSQEDNFHVTSCPQYIAPEKPQCYCQIKCTEPNVWCDVCGFDISKCGGGAEEAVPYQMADGCQAHINVTVVGDATAMDQGGVYAEVFVFMTGFGYVDLIGPDGDNEEYMINGVIHIPYPSDGMTLSRCYLYPIAVEGYTVTMTGAAERKYYEQEYPTSITVTYTKIGEKHTITISDAIENGTVQANVTEAATDETVTLTITPDPGYELDTIAVNSGGVILSGTGNTRTFTMPAGNVTVTASFKLIPYEVKNGVLIVRTKLTELPEESFDSICVESGGELALNETVAKPVEVKAGGKLSSGTYSAAVTNAGTIEGVRFSEGASVSGTEPVSVIHSVDGVDTALAYNALLKSELPKKDGYFWSRNGTKLTDTDKVPLSYTAYTSAVCTHEDAPVASTTCPDCGAAIEKVTTFDISPANDGQRSDYAALEAAFSLLYTCPYTSGDSITVTGSREVDRSLTLCIPGGVSVDWKARLTSSTNALSLYGGAGSFTLSDGLIKAVDYNGIVLANDFAGSFTITGGSVESVNDVGIVSNGSHITIDGDTSIQSSGVAIGLYGAASVSVTGDRVTVNSESNRGFYADNSACKVTVSGDSHLTVTGESIGHMPTPGEGETAFFRSGEGEFTTAITEAASYEILTGSHATVTPGLENHTITCACTGGVNVTESHADNDSIPGCDICGLVTYPIWVLGTQVNSLNKDDVLGDGTVKYAPDTGLLYIKGADLTAADYGIRAESDLTIYVYGDNRSNPIYSDTGSIHFMGDGKLTVNSSQGIAPIRAGVGSVSITGPTVFAAANGGSVSAIHASSVALKDGHLIASSGGDTAAISGTLNLLTADYFSRSSTTGSFVHNSMDNDAAYVELVGVSHLSFDEATSALTCGHGVSIPIAASVTIHGITDYYMDIQSAIDGAENGTADALATLKLLRDAELTKTLAIDKGSFTLDLNGHAIRGNVTNAMIRHSGGKLTITDSSTGEPGSITNTNGWAIQTEAGELTLEKGTVSGTSYGILVSDTAKLVVDGGTITGKTYALHTLSGGTSTVNDGTLKGPYALYTAGQVTLNGGTLEGTRADIHVVNPFTVGDLGSANYTLSIVNEYALPLHIATAAQGTTPKPGWFSYVTPTGTADSDYMFVEGSRQVNGTALIQGGAANELYLYHCEHVYGEHNERRQEGVCSQCGTQFAAILNCALTTQETEFICGYTSVDAALAELDRVLGTNAQAAAYLYVYQDYTGDIAIELPGTSTIRVYFSNHTLHGQLSFAGLGQIYDIKINNPDGYGVKMLGDKRLMIYENVTIESGADAADIWLSQGVIGQCQSSGPFTVAVEDVPGPGESRRVAASSPVNINYLVSADPSLALVKGSQFIQLTHRLKSVTPLLGNVEAAYDDQTGSYSATYNANAASLEIEDYLGNPLSLGTHYTVTWKQDGTTLNSAPSNAGTYTYTVTGLGDYAGITHTGTLEITKVSASSIYWNSYSSPVTYDGQPLETPDVEFRMPGGIELNPDRILWQDHDAAEDAPWNEGTPTNVGRYKLRAMLDESQNYMSGWSTRNVEILPAELTVSVTAAAREYNGETAVELTATLDGVEGSDDVTLTNEGKYTGTVESADAGENKAVALPTFTIEGKDTGNYTLTQPTGVTVTISPRAFTPGVTLSPAKLTYNGKEHEPTVTVKDGTTVISAIEYTVTYTNNKNAGTATVTITDKTGGNYIFAEQRKTFTIDRAVVTITAENKTAVVGDTQPALTYTVTGLIDPDKLTTAPTLACMADMDAAGTYAITVTGGDAGSNYTIQHVNGTLAVKAMHTITVNAGSNGTVSISPASAVEGTEITITVTPKSGYKMATITVKDANGDSRAVSTDNKGKYYFTMPDANVTVTVTFSKISTSTADPTNPKTGDNLHILMYGSLLTMSLAGLTALLLASRKRRRKV